jgi:hypothetical protein
MVIHFQVWGDTAQRAINYTKKPPFVNIFLQIFDRCCHKIDEKKGLTCGISTGKYTLYHYIPIRYRQAIENLQGYEDREKITEYLKYAKKHRKSISNVYI